MDLPQPAGRQQEVLYLPPTGHVVVLGAAGSGKTIMAAHRARYLSNPQHSHRAPTLLVTYNRALINYFGDALNSRADRQITPMTFHAAAKSALQACGRDTGPTAYLSDPIRMTTLTNRAILRARKSDSNPVFDRSTKFFDEELSWLAAHGIESLDDYLGATRIGRSATKLTGDQRGAVWRVRQAYLELRSEKGHEFDLRDIASASRAAIERSRPALTHRHVVIDEGQDLTPEMLRTLASMVGAEGSLTFFGDYTQQIYGHRLSWKSAGLTVRKIWRFKENYRNTQEIAKVAETVSHAPSFAESDEPLDAELPDRHGPKPSTKGYRSEDAEIGATAHLAAQRAHQGMSVAVLSRTGREANKVRLALGDGATRLSRDTHRFAEPMVYCGTIHAAKGLEFDAVFLMGLNDQHWPEPVATRDWGSDAAKARDLKLLYVGITRARQHLSLSYTGTVTELVPSSTDLVAA